MKQTPVTDNVSGLTESKNSQEQSCSVQDLLMITPGTITTAPDQQKLKLFKVSP